jgi:hypothetical protein
MASSRLRAYVELCYSFPVNVDPRKRPAILVPPFTLDDQFAGLNASLQPPARFGSARLLESWRVQTFDPHSLTPTLQRAAVNCATTFTSRRDIRQSYGQ